MKEFLDQSKRDNRIAKVALKLNAKGESLHQKSKTPEEEQALFKKYFKEINPNDYPIGELRKRLEAGIKYFEGEIQDLKEKHINISDDDQNKIDDYKAKILNNTLWITKIDDFIDGSRINIDGSTFNEN